VICGIANSLWLAGCLPDAARFRRATTRVGEEQAAILLRLLRVNADTEFGHRHRFSTITSAREYQERVPFKTFDEYRPLIDRVAAGAPNVLTGERVRLFEPTSGSSGATKLIPYTPALQQEFQRGIRPWVADLFLHQPQLANGQAYWSVSPVGVPNRKTAGGISIGFEDDSAYVGGWQRRMVNAVMAVPSEIRNVSDVDEFRYRTLLALVRAANLRLISVWHPTFLTLLVDRLPDYGEALLRDLSSDAIRKDVLSAALRAGTPAERHTILWPRLGLISCWSDGNASAPARRLATLFPHARVQGKGLIATEGFVSFPLTGREGAALAVRSHFFEFVSVDATGAPDAGVPCLAHELETGRRYSVVMSTGGGLYRYQLQDVIQVLGYVGDCPLIRFVGRQGQVSDWVGEKLNEVHVTRVLRHVFASAGLAPEFAMLAYDDTLSNGGYVLYIETVEPSELLTRIANRIDDGLQANFHYAQARRLGQLAPIRTFRATNAAETYMITLNRSGQRLGDVKPAALDPRNGWSQSLTGEFLEPFNPP
jgi:hypothetical protein